MLGGALGLLVVSAMSSSGYNHLSTVSLESSQRLLSSAATCGDGGE